MLFACVVSEYGSLNFVFVAAICLRLQRNFDKFYRTIIPESSRARLVSVPGRPRVNAVSGAEPDLSREFLSSVNSLFI